MPDENKAFGEAALAKGYITEMQLTSCYEALLHVKRAGLTRSMGELMVEKGLITPVQVEIIERSIGTAKVRIIGGFEILGQIGAGGMGQVFKARQISMDRIVALKLLGDAYSKDKEFAARFLREARVAAKLDHVNIVRGIDVGCDEDTYYFAMEYVEGKSVGDILDDMATIPEERAIRIVMQVARALSHAWTQSLIHRDIKPDNILITKDDVAKLADLGLAKSTEAISTVMTMTGVAVGTPHYMSPEQARGEKDIDIRTDIYSLGATLYHMVTGATPFTGSTAAVVLTKHLTEEPTPVGERNPELSAGLIGVIERMMDKSVDRRYATPDELIVDLELVADGKEPIPSAVESIQIEVRDAKDLSLVDSTSATQPMINVEQAVEDTNVLMDAKVLDLAASTDPTLLTPTAKAKKLLPIYIAAVVVLVVVLGFVLGGGTPDEDTATSLTKLDALEQEAKAFYLEQLVAFTEGQYLEVASRLSKLNGKYDATIQAEKISELAGNVADKLAEKQKLEEENLKAEQEKARRAKTIETVKNLLLDEKTENAWRHIKEARLNGMTGADLDELAAKVLARLKPKGRITGPLGMEFALISAGKFKMGSNDGARNEAPEHSVELSAYYIGVYEVTLAQWRAYRGDVREVVDGREPVTGVSWSDAVKFCEYLTQQDKRDARYRLPTEAEWEYAAVGSKGRKFPWGDEAITKLHANLEGEADGFSGLAPVGSFALGVSPEGVHDMFGNAAEWCGDWYGAYSNANEFNPHGPAAGRDKVVRGSAYAYGVGQWSRTTKRAVAAPDARMDTIGFRVVRELLKTEAEFERLGR